MLGKFKAGDVVRITRRTNTYYGHLGIVRDFSRGSLLTAAQATLYYVQLMSDLGGKCRLYYASSLEKIDDV